MLGQIIRQGIISGCRMEGGELYYLISRADGKPGIWTPARQAVRPAQPLAERYRGQPLRSLEFGRQAQSTI